MIHTVQGSNQKNLQLSLPLSTSAGHSTGLKFTKNRKNAQNGQYMSMHEKALAFTLGGNPRETLPATSVAHFIAK